MSKARIRIPYSQAKVNKLLFIKYLKYYKSFKYNVFHPIASSFSGGNLEKKHRKKFFIQETKAGQYGKGKSCYHE